ncbi:hypothetical protein [Microbacterium testaceum]|uniref:hypothetical protein n=1 Tax=Microbacterium testaceum TaxID=2033 RepID=UPI001D17B668|nr:hypothetical protein [Microbacterium testaceum]MCC4248620.1 hypothetical protein [Microbacterium testaceum]
MTPNRRIAAVLSTASALAIGVAAYLPMVLSGHITRDSGVFLYTGMVVSRGGMPYVDSWDHKGPLLAAIETAAWQLGGGIVGAPVLEALVLTLGLGVAGVMWTRWIGAWAAVAVLVTGVTYLGVFEGGNFTETWLFPFQLVAYSAAARVALTCGRDAPARVAGWAGLIIGLALAVGLYTRMNNVAGLLLLTVIGTLFLRRRLNFAGAVVLAVGVVGTALALWLLTGDALRAAVDQYVRYNLFYSGGAGAAERLDAFGTLSTILVSGAVVATALLFLGAWILTQRSMDGGGRNSSAVIALFLAVGGLDALSQMISGRPYPHYLVVAIPGFAVAVVVMGARLLPAVSRLWPARRPGSLPFMAGGAALAVVTLVLSSSTVAALEWSRTVVGAGVFREGSYQAQLVDKVRAETSPDDRVLVHGAETWILASAERLSPTAITYSLPVEQGYGSLPAQYLADLTSLPPALIVESPESCGISNACTPDKANFEGLAPWVASGYELEGDLFGFRFWRRIAP